MATEHIPFNLKGTNTLPIHFGWDKKTSHPFWKGSLAKIKGKCSGAQRLFHQCVIVSCIFILLVRMRFFSPVWLLPWFLTVVIVLESLVTIHTTKGFFTSVDCLVYFHITGKGGFLSLWLLPWFLTVEKFLKVLS